MKHENEDWKFYGLLLILLTVIWIAILILWPSGSEGQEIGGIPREIQIEWDHNLEEDLAGYRVYAGEVSFAGVIPVGVSPVAEIPAGQASGAFTVVPASGVVYIVVTAYDMSGNESGPSNEVVEMFDVEAPGAPVNARTKKVTIIININ